MGSDQTIPKHMRYNSDIESFTFDQAVTQTLCQSNMIVAKSWEALEKAIRDEQSL